MSGSSDSALALLWFKGVGFSIQGLRFIPRRQSIGRADRGLWFQSLYAAKEEALVRDRRSGVSNPTS